MSLGFLIGAGVSSIAGLPNTAWLTERIRSGQDVINPGAGFRVGEPPLTQNPIYTEPVKPVVAFVGTLAELADSYYRLRAPGKEVNYEDICYLARQIADCLLFEYENPALLPLIEELAGRFTDGDESKLCDLAGRTVDYVHGVVWSELDRHAGDVRTFTPIVEAAEALDELDIFTLNHDTLVEQALHHAGIEHADGFEQPWGDVAIWTDTFTRPGPRLLKLHGSFDWLRLWIEDRTGGRQAAVRKVSGDMLHLKGPNGEALDFPADGRPQFLAGTFNKVLDYASGIYAEQHYRFNERMRVVDNLVVSGYSFGDKAVNSQLIAWLGRRTDNKLLLIHPDPEALWDGARPAIRSALRRAAGAGQVVIIDKGFQEADWATIQDMLELSSTRPMPQGLR